MLWNQTRWSCCLHMVSRQAYTRKILKYKHTFILVWSLCASQYFVSHKKNARSFAVPAYMLLIQNSRPSACRMWKSRGKYKVKGVNDVFFLIKPWYKSLDQITNIIKDISILSLATSLHSHLVHSSTEKQQHLHITPNGICIYVHYMYVGCERTAQSDLNDFTKQQYTPEYFDRARASAPKISHSV